MVVMSIRSKYIKLTTIINERGLGFAAESIMRYFSRIFFRIELESYYTFESDLSAISNFDNSIKPVEVSKLNNSDTDIKKLIAFWPDYYRFKRSDSTLEDDIKKYFKVGDECFCAVIDNKIVGMMWVGYEKNYMLKTMAKKDGLKSDEAIIHRVFVSKEHRGHRIQNFLSIYIMMYLKRNNFKKVRTYVGINNIAAIISNMKIYDKYKIIYHLKVTIFVFEFNLFPKYPNDWSLIKSNGMKKN
jgi:hypothetical protein